MKNPETLEILSRKWHPRIIQHLLENGCTRFSNLKTGIDGISGKALSESLQDLEERGIVERDKQGYVLTDKGQEMKQIFRSVREWEERFSSRQEILVVEDDESQAELYTRWLEPEYNVSEAGTEAEVFEALDESPEAVILDQNLDGEKGSELLNKVDLEDTPVIMVTGNEPEEEVLDVEAHEYLIKPVSRDNLHTAVSEALEQSGSRREKLARLVAEKEMVARSGDRERYEELENRIEELVEEIEREPGKLSKAFNP